MSIQVSSLSKRFGSFAALDDVSFTVQQGELLALLGPSGSGKTTLLRIIAGLERADSGSVLFDGDDAARRDPRDRGVGFVFQHYALFRHMTVFENVAFGLRVRPRAAAAGGGGHPPARHRSAGARAARLPWQPLSLAALGRPAAARGARAGPGGRTESAAPRRAVRGARRQGPPGAAPLAAPAACGNPSDQCVRDARPGRGARARQSRRGDERGTDRAGRHSRRSRRASGDAVRRQFPRTGEHLPWPGPGWTGPARPAGARVSGASGHGGAAGVGLFPAA